MHRVRIPSGALEQTPLRFSPEVCHYLHNVLRLRVGDNLGVFDGSGQEWQVCLTVVSARHIEGEKVALLSSATPEILPLVLGQGIPKGTKMDFVVEKCTELGLDVLVPVETERTVVRPLQERSGTRIARWQRLANTAARQCGRRTVLEIHTPAALAAFCAQYSYAPYKIVCWEEERQRSLSQVLPRINRGPVVILIGPEGGLAPREVALAQTYDFVPVSLGQWILRTETAAVAITSIVRYSLGDFEPKGRPHEANPTCLDQCMA